MKPVTYSQIEQFLQHDSFVLYGVSRNKDKMGNAILKELTQKGMKIFPIHKEMEMVENQQCYLNLAALPEKVNAAIICTKPEKTSAILEELKDYGIENIWLQQGSADKDMIRKAVENFANIIYSKCILLFVNPSGIHKFHSSLLRFFRRYPK